MNDKYFFYIYIPHIKGIEKINKFEKLIKIGPDNMALKKKTKSVP